MVTSRGSRVAAESVLLRRETNRDIRVGSKGSFWAFAHDFRATPISSVPISGRFGRYVQKVLPRLRIRIRPSCGAIEPASNKSLLVKRLENFISRITNYFMGASRKLRTGNIMV